MLSAFLEPVQQVQPSLDGVVRVFELLLVNDPALVHRCGRLYVGFNALLLFTRKAFHQLFRGWQLSARRQQVDRDHIICNVFNRSKRGRHFSASPPVVF